MPDSDFLSFLIKHSRSINYFTLNAQLTNWTDTKLKCLSYDKSVTFTKSKYRSLLSCQSVN